ncbi:hypothetical protein LEP1GSC199_0060 [Leptospira vanthielii serovar Holland str. Waz Holland = ATCC 700522]|uniref:Uncharacterized protein n=1 Tax=Leptospira vanthielii serovar Holland str. Waz Holland = ATCC 700522 TaxID=1218591 RepID=N1WER5_9LEPT|nr:hypothetical protein LEP1GSC199_0060 [Leptospira vanthielii serovar Holland str. Waz Holland = ATCC 700522]
MVELKKAERKFPAFFIFLNSILFAIELLEVQTFWQKE